MTFRSTLFWGHLVTGLTIGCFIVAMSITGMLLSFRPQILQYVEQGGPQKSEARQLLKKIESWHRFFGTTGDLKIIVRTIKGIITIAFALMLLSGLYLWWPYKLLKPTMSNWNLHNTIGFWTAPFLLIIAITGTFIAFQPGKKEGPKKEMPQQNLPKKPLTVEQKQKKFIKRLHTGEVAGIVGETIGFLASGSAILLVWTGSVMAIKRIKKKSKRSSNV